MKERFYNIADIMIALDWSKSKTLSTEKSKAMDGFICRQARRPDIRIYIEDKNFSNMSKTRLFSSGTDWELFTNGDRFIYEKKQAAGKGSLLQRAVFNKHFTEGTLSLKPPRIPVPLWDINNIMNDFMQVVLLNFLAYNKAGILAHSSSFRSNGKGLAFFGVRSAGKSTMARIWKENRPDIELLNDDRCAIRLMNGRFMIYSTPWTGTFSRYELSPKETTLDRAYFIYHNKKNVARGLGQATAFTRIMQNIFPPFWSRQGMEFIVSFCDKFAGKVKCYDLGFVNDEKVIGFLEKRSNR